MSWLPTAKLAISGAMSSDGREDADDECASAAAHNAQAPMTPSEASRRQSVGAKRFMCTMCKASRGTLSPLDGPSATERAWAPSGHECKLCADTEATLARVDLMRLAPPAHPGTTGWHIMVKSFVSLKLENCEPSVDALLNRYKVLSLVMPSVADEPAESTSPSVVSMFSASAQASGAIHGAGQGDIAAEYSTPDGKSSSRRKYHSPASSPRPASSSHPSAPFGTSGSAYTQPQAANTPPAPFQSPSPWTRTAPGVEPLVKLVDFHRLSVDGPFHNGTLGSSMGRFRSTINEYCDLVEEEWWACRIKAPTMKALQRRLNSCEPQVRQIADLDLITAFLNLQQRLAGLIRGHKSLLSFRSTQLDQHLADFAYHMAPIRMYMEAKQGDHEFSAELRILLVRAKFICTSRASSVSAALKELDHDKWLYDFSKLPTVVPIAKEEDPDVDDGVGSTAAEVPSHGVAEVMPATSRRFPGSKVKAKPIDAFRVVSPAIAVEYLAGVVDGQLQAKMHLLPGEGQGQPHHDALEKMADDLIGVVVEWKARFANGDEMAGISFGDFLQQTANLFMASVGKHKMSVAASSIRVACQEVTRAAASNSFTFKSAIAMTSMLGYDACKSVMASAQDLASVGLQDTAADLQFKAALNRIETALEMAFSSFGSFIASGNNGDWHTMASMRGLFEMAKGVVVELTMCIGMWSLAGLEHEQDGIIDLLNCAVIIIQLSNVVAARDFVQRITMSYSAAVARMLSSDGDSEAQLASDAACANEIGAVGAPGLEERAVDEPDICAVIGKASVPHMLAELAHRFSSDFAIFSGDLAQVLFETQSVYDSLVAKLGDGFVKASMEVLPPPEEVQPQLVAHAEMLKMSCDYLCNVVFLASCEPLKLDKPIVFEDNNIYMEKLSAFCNTHRYFAEPGRFKVDIGEQFEDLLLEMKLEAIMVTFHNIMGQHIYDSHASPSIKAATDWMEALQVTVNPIDQHTIDSISEVSSLVSATITHPSVETGCKLLDDLRLDESLCDDMSRMTHSLVLKNLEAFIQATGSELVQVATIKKPNNDHLSQVPASYAVHFFKAKCAMFSVALTFIGLHHYFVLPVSKGDPSQSLTSIMVAPSLSKAMATHLCDLNALVNSPVAAAMQSDAIITPISWPVIGMWRATMAASRRRLTNMVLDSWSQSLETQTAKCKAAVPSLELCVANGTWDDRMAANLLGGKAASLAKHHNELHDILSTMGSRAAMMEVTPRLQDNDHTSQSVKLALHTMSLLRDATTVANGIAILEGYKQHHQGPSKAKDFLNKFLPSNRPATIPTQFWARLESMASGRLLVIAPPSLRMDSATSAASSAGNGPAPPSAMRSQEQVRSATIGAASAAASVASRARVKDEGSSCQQTAHRIVKRRRM